MQRVCSVQCGSARLHPPYLIGLEAERPQRQGNNSATAERRSSGWLPLLLHRELQGMRILKGLQFTAMAQVSGV